MRSSSRFRPFRSIVALLSVLLGASAAVVPARADSYADPDYLAHELDNMTRSLTVGSRQVDALLDPDQLSTIVLDGAAEWLDNLGTQLTGLFRGRLFVSLGQLLPGAGVGDPRTYGDLEPVEVDFASRTGALLHGRLWWDGRPGPHPGVVITSGSIQSPAVGYHWAAQSLAAAGYLVLTWDPQGQGESEMFGHEAGDPLPTLEGVPFQQEANFVDGTVDALRFLLSSPTDAYLPTGWSVAQGHRHRAQAVGSDLDWSNPLWSALDRDRVGLAGHSLGARAVSVVQQCSDAADRWRSVPACGGRSFPIRAVVGWDRLSGGRDIVPVVPAMDQQADGYFLAPEPSPQAPDPAAHLGALRQWAAAGVDSYSMTLRGATHCEWSWIPVICTATEHGLASADFYTRAWFDRYLHPAIERQRLGGHMLLFGPAPDRLTGGRDELPWRADFLSVRYRSAFNCQCLIDGPRIVDGDVRRHVGLSVVGDWAAANRDRPAVRHF